MTNEYMVYELERIKDKIKFFDFENPLKAQADLQYMYIIIDMLSRYYEFEENEANKDRNHELKINGIGEEG